MRYLGCSTDDRAFAIRYLDGFRWMWVDFSIVFSGEIVSSYGDIAACIQ